MCQWQLNSTKKLRSATIYNYGMNGAKPDRDLLSEENSEDISASKQKNHDFLDQAIADYNSMLYANYSTDGERFWKNYRDVSLQMKNKELALLIVVNVFLTGLDAGI